MKNNKLIFVVSITVILIGTFIFTIVSKMQHKVIMPLESNCSGVIAFQKEEITEFGIWRIGNSEDDFIFYQVQKIKSNKDYPNGGESLDIYDQNNKLIYEEKAEGFSGIETLNLTKQSKKQLIIKAINYGGSGKFFKILDYQEGKIVSLTNEDDTLYSGDVQIIPQYQREVKSYSVPYQIFLTDNMTSVNPHAKILRYTKGRYISVGEVNQTKVGDFINENISKKE